MQQPHHPYYYGSDQTSPHTTFVQADPSTFRAIVQKLTGASDVPTTRKLPLALIIPSSSSSPAAANLSHSSVPSSALSDHVKPPVFKLHERRHQKVGHIQLIVSSRRDRGGGGETIVMVSPVSPLDLFATTPSSLLSPSEQEEKIIAEKGFYLHPIPLSLSTRHCPVPKLLPLFPIHSPRDDRH